MVQFIGNEFILTEIDQLRHQWHLRIDITNSYILLATINHN